MARRMRTLEQPGWHGCRAHGWWWGAGERQASACVGEAGRQPDSVRAVARRRGGGKSSERGAAQVEHLGGRAHCRRSVMAEQVLTRRDFSAKGSALVWIAVTLPASQAWEPSLTPPLIRVFLCPRLRIERTAAALLALCQPSADLDEPVVWGWDWHTKSGVRILAPPAYPLVGPSPAYLHRLLSAQGG